jgi:hypothetical protein
MDLDAQHRSLVSGSDFEEAEIGFRQNITDLPKAGALRCGPKRVPRFATSAPRSNRDPKSTAAGLDLSVRGGSRSRARRKAAPPAEARPPRSPSPAPIRPEMHRRTRRALSHKHAQSWGFGGFGSMLLAGPGKALYMSRPLHSAACAWSAPFV